MKCLVFIFMVFCVIPMGAAEEDKSADPKGVTIAKESVERRQKVELLGYFLKSPKDAKLPQTTLAIEFYNKAVGYFGRNQYDLARQSLQDSLKHDNKNSLAYELLGEIDYLEQKLANAKTNYEKAYGLSPREGLKKKIEKLESEMDVEKKLATYREKNFIIKYHGEEQTYEGFELRELLRHTYQNISKDFAYYFSHQVVVLLYDEEEFRKLVSAPHWASGVYDGKIRLPAYKKGFGDQELRALTAHEVTHAFVAGMSGNRAPAWINEGLAEYEENKIKKVDPLIFKAAVKTNTLLPLDQLMSQAATSSFQDALKAGLFYVQSFQLVNYLIERYGMFRVKQLLTEFANRKNSDEAIQNVLKISVGRLEKEWKATFSK